MDVGEPGDDKEAFMRDVVALEPGYYRDFTGYVNGMTNEGMARDAEFDIDGKGVVERLPFTSMRGSTSIGFMHNNPRIITNE